MAIHTYESALSWTAGYADEHGHPSDHQIILPPETVLDVSADQAFKGDPRRANPEQLLLAAASSCQFLSFAYVAAQTNLRLAVYRDTASAVLDVGARPPRIVGIHLRPSIAFDENVSLSKLEELCDRAHQLCYVGNTLNCPIRVEPNHLQTTP